MRSLAASFLPVRMPSAPGRGAPSEHQAFLVLCNLLAGRREAERQRGIAEIVSQFDGIAALVAVAEQERVLSALHEVVARDYAELVPKLYRAMLAIRYEANRRRNAAIGQALRELGQAGALAGVRFAALKGAAWLIEDEADCAPWRQMIDIDVLVDPQQFDAIPPMLERLGYTVANRSRRFEQNFHHPPFRHPEIPATLEVHRHIGWRHRLLPPEMLLRDARPVGAGLLLPVPWVRALHAVIHWQIQDRGGQRGTLPLKELIELARFMQRSDVDWTALAAHAEQAGVARACEVATAGAAVLLDAPPPRAFPPSAGARQATARSIARRSSPRRTWLATEVWRIGTLWWCEKVAYRCALRGRRPSTIALTVWGARIVRLPILALRAAGIAARAIAGPGSPV